VCNIGIHQSVHRRIGLTENILCELLFCCAGVKEESTWKNNYFFGFFECVRFVKKEKTKCRRGL